MGKKKALEPLNCPQCGGAVDLDDNQEYGFCKYCGTKVINTYSVKQKVEITNVPTIENYLKLGDRAYKGGDFKNASHYYVKVIEIDADNFHALGYDSFCKLYAADYTGHHTEFFNAMEIAINSKKKHDKEFFEILENDLNIYYNQILDKFNNVQKFGPNTTYDVVFDLKSSVDRCRWHFEYVIDNFINGVLEEKLRKYDEQRYNTLRMTAYTGLAYLYSMLSVDHNYAVITNKGMKPCVIGLSEQELNTVTGKFNSLVEKIKAIDANYVPPTMHKMKGVGSTIAIVVFNIGLVIMWFILFFIKNTQTFAAIGGLLHLVIGLWIALSAKTQREIYKLIG